MDPVDPVLDLTQSSPSPDKEEEMEEEVRVEEAVDAEEEEEAAMTAELELLTTRLGVEGAHEQELAACLVVLLSLQVTVPALLATKAGRVVRRLRGRQGEVGRLATIIVNNWKRLVLEYEEQEEQEEQEEVAEKEVEVQEEEGVAEKVVVARYDALRERMPGLPTSLRPFQVDVLTAASDPTNSKHIFIGVPTGGGKTLVQFLLPLLAPAGTTSIIIAPLRTILEQMGRDCLKLGISYADLSQVRPEKLGEVLATQPSLLLASVESLEDALVLIYTFLEYTFTWIT